MGCITISRGKQSRLVGRSGDGITEPLTIEPIGIAIPPGDAQLKSLLDAYLTAFEGTGLLEGVRKKWLEDASWLAALP